MKNFGQNSGEYFQTDDADLYKKSDRNFNERLEYKTSFKTDGNFDATAIPKISYGGKTCGEICGNKRMFSKVDANIIENDYD